MDKRTQKVTELVRKAMESQDVEFVMNLMDVVKHEPSGSATSGMHGDGGIFSRPGADPEIFSAVMRPKTFLDALPLVRNEYANEVTEIMTQVTNTQGTAPDDLCGDPATTGDVQVGRVVREYGQLFLKTKVVNIADVGQLRDRADMERTIMNSAATDDPFLPDPLRLPGVNFRSRKAQNYYELGMGVQRAWGKVAVEGNSTTTGGSREREWIKEPDGLERLITSGLTDTSGTAIPGADSLVVTWGSTTGATISQRRIGRLLHEMIYSRQVLAGDTGLNPRWALVGDRRLYFELVYELASHYASVKTNAATSGLPITMDMSTGEARYLEMMNSQTLRFGNLLVPYLFTSGVETTISQGSIESDLFFVPIDSNGAPVTKIDYFPLDNQYIQEFANTTNRVATNNGMYLFATRSDGYCDQDLVTMKGRLHCRAPFLGFRLDNITYSAYVGYRDAMPGEGSFMSGGLTRWDGTYS